MKAILDIKIPPIITYQNIAYTMVMILSRPGLKNLLYNHFIQWVCPSNYFDTGNFYINCKDSHYFTNKYMYGHFVYKKRLKNNLHTTIQDFIQDNRYVVLDGLDVYYIENGQFFEQLHFPHDIMVYGYDNRRGIYNILAYDYNRFFRPFECSFAGLEKAVNSTYIEDKGFALGMTTKNAHVPLSKEVIFMRIAEYLKGGKGSSAEVKECYFGVTVYQHCIEAIHNSLMRNMNCLRFIKEHKQLMLERLKMIGVNPNIILQYKKDVCEAAEVLWNLSIKCSIGATRELLERIVAQIGVIRDNEVNILSQLVSL